MILAAAVKRSRGDYDKLVSHIPDKMKNAPELWPGLELYYDAFIQLSAGRSNGPVIPDPLPFSEISAYAMHYGILGDDFERFSIYVRGLDTAYMEFVRKKAQKK